jgi:hypothetical protein
LPAAVQVAAEFKAIVQVAVEVPVDIERTLDLQLLPVLQLQLQ